MKANCNPQGWITSYPSDSLISWKLPEEPCCCFWLKQLLLPGTVVLAKGPGWELQSPLPAISCCFLSGTVWSQQGLHLSLSFWSHPTSHADWACFHDTLEGFPLQLSLQHSKNRGLGRQGGFSARHCSLSPIPGQRWWTVGQERVHSSSHTVHSPQPMGLRCLVSELPLPRTLGGQVNFVLRSSVTLPPYSWLWLLVQFSQSKITSKDSKKKKILEINDSHHFNNSYYEVLAVVVYCCCVLSLLIISWHWTDFMVRSCVFEGWLPDYKCSEVERLGHCRPRA